MIQWQDFGIQLSMMISLDDYYYYYIFRYYLLGGYIVKPANHLSHSLIHRVGYEYKGDTDYYNASSYMCNGYFSEIRNIMFIYLRRTQLTLGIQFAYNITKCWGGNKRLSELIVVQNKHRSQGLQNGILLWCFCSRRQYYYDKILSEELSIFRSRPNTHTKHCQTGI